MNFYKQLAFAKTILVFVFLIQLSGQLKAEKNEMYVGFSYYNSSLDRIIDLSNAQASGASVNGLSLSLLYFHYFVNELMFYRFDFGSDYSFNKKVNSTNGSITFRESRREFTPVMIGPNLAVKDVHLYTGIGITYVNYRLNVRQENARISEETFSLAPDFSDFLYKTDVGYNANGWGTTFVLGLVANISDKAKFYTEFKFFEAPIRGSFSNDASLNTENPPANVFINPRYQRLYFGFGGGF